MAIGHPSDLFRESAHGASRDAADAVLRSPAGDATRTVGRSAADVAMRESRDAADGSPYASAKREVERILDAAAAGHAFQVSGLLRLVADMATSILNGDDLLVQALNDGDVDFDLARHQVNTAIFAIKVGQGAGCRPEELPRLGLAACLHDVGMIVVPKRILDHPGPLGAEEWTVVRDHPEHGSRILQRLGADFEWLAQVALQEHEREDGSGYPAGLKGNEIHEHAKIVGVADAYESLTHVRPYRGKRSAFDAVKELITVQRAKFPDRVLKGLIRGLSTFPVGSHVRLNSMEIARIVGTNPTFPLRPVIDVVVGPKGERLDPPRRVDLAANTLLYVTEACSGSILA